MNAPATTNRAIQDIYPLSPTQRGLLFHSLYGDSQTGAYIVQVSYTLKGELDHDAFNKAWQQLVDRHTILRTAFVWENLEAPVQVVGRQATLPIHWHDWASLTAEEQQAQLSGLMKRDRAQGFNLSNAPLMRINAVQLGQNHYRIVWTHHHILLDGWSLPLLLKEWIACYQAACNSDAQLPSFLDKSYPYRDYIAWLQQQDASAAKQFWKAQLSGINAPTPLGIDRLSAKKESANDDSRAQSAFDEQSYALSAELTKQLKSFAQQNRITLSSLVQGAWAKVLSVYSSESTVLYGLARAGRPDSLQNAQQRVGLFFNTLPMRVNVPADGNVISWLQEIQAQQLTQQPYEYTPLVDIQAVSDIPRQSPLFESIVVFENYPLAAMQGITGITLSEVSITEQTHYPLTLFAVATETLELKVLYDTQRFEKDAISRLFGHLHTALCSIAFVTDPPRRYAPANINIISSDEQKQLNIFAQGPKVPVTEQCVQDLIAQQATSRPNKTALVFEGESLSYEQLNSRANQLANHLQQQGISPGTLIGLCMERSIEMIVALLAILKLGCAYVPLDPIYPEARLQYAVTDAGVRWLVCHHATAQKILSTGNILHHIDVSKCADEISLQPDTALSLQASPEDLAYLIYTSGSTGKPKGVPITHLSLSNLLAAMANRLQVKPADTFMAVTTVAFDIAALELFLPLISGGCLLLASNETARDSQQIIAYLDTYGVDMMQATPSTWRLLLRSGWAGQSGLKILCGGEALDAALAYSLLDCAEEVWNVYGPTETTIWSSALLLSKALLETGHVPIGQPIDNTQFYVLDQQQKPVPVGVDGELYIGGVGLSQGYWNQPDQTAGQFIHSPFPIPHSPFPILYKTGDRVRYRENGTIDYLGRFDYQTKLRGYRIELSEIESVIAQHSRINQAVVVLRGASAETQHLAAYLTLTSGEPFGDSEKEKSLVQDVRSHLTQHLPHYMVPTAYKVLPAFPLTPNGKIDRKALPKITREADAANTRPKTPIENTLANIWQTILPSEEEEKSGKVTVGIHDNFFEIGGHSLLVINAQSQIRQQLGVELSMVDFFRYPTLSTLAAHIARQSQSENLSGQSSGQQQSKERKENRKIAVATGKERLKKRRERQLTQRQSADRLGGKTT